MEAILAMPSPDRGREFVLPLSLGGVRVRTVVQSGAQLVGEVGREPADCIILPETLPDGPAELWLGKVAAVSPQRPAAIVLVYGVEGSATVRERVRAAFGPAVEVIAAGARRAEEVAAEAARLLDKLARTMAEQDQDAYARLRQPVPSSTVPQPVRQGGALALVGMSGGVGTSTLVANLATYAAMAGQRVLILDAQFATASSALYYLGAEPDEQNRGLHHLRWTHLSKGGQPREAAVEEVSRRLEDVRIRGVRHAEIKVLQVPAILEQMVGMTVDQVLWGLEILEREFDLVLLDCGSGLGDPRTVRLLEQASRILLVAGGWGSGVNALVRGLSALHEWGESRIDKERLFLLLRESADGVYGARTVSSASQMPVYGRLPEEPLIRKAEGRLGARVPIVVDGPDSPYAQSVAQLAYCLGAVQQVDARPREARRGLFGLTFSRR